MTHKIKIIYITTLFFAAACNSNGYKNPAEQKQAVGDTLENIKPVKKFAHIRYASKRDTTCGMPLSAGIEDTLVLKGKVYGFCSGECKADFVTILKKQHKR